MKNYPYVIIGGGMAADSAVAGIREIDPNGEILIISAEQNPPYDRPALSKGLWKGKPLEKIWRDTSGKNAELILGQPVSEIQAEEKIVMTGSGERFGYGTLLLATGGKPRRLPFGGEGVIYYRNLEDYQRLRAITEKKERFAVIGSGFIGSEIAAALAMAGKDVTIIYIGTGIGWNIFPAGMTEFHNDYYRDKGVKLILNTKVNGIEKAGNGYRIQLQSNASITVDGVIAGVGIRPDTSLADALQIKVDNGIHVDEFLRTPHKDIYAAGDTANFYNPLLGKRIRVEHADNANRMGRQAGRNMAGAEELYHYLPFFYSDLFDLGYEAVGLLDARCEVVEDWQSLYKKGVIYYLEDKRVRGVLLWNVWDKTEQAREVIGLPAPVDAGSLVGRIR